MKQKIGGLGCFAAFLFFAVACLPNLWQGIRLVLCVGGAVVYLVSYLAMIYFQTSKNHTTKSLSVQYADERNCAIREKTQNAANIINTVLMSVAVVAAVLLQMWWVAVAFGVVLLVQPLMFLCISKYLQKTM